MSMALFMIRFVFDVTFFPRPNCVYVLFSVALAASIKKKESESHNRKWNWLKWYGPSKWNRMALLNSAKV